MSPTQYLPKGDEGQGHHLLGSAKVLSSGYLSKNGEAGTWLWAYYSKQNFITILQFSWCRHQARKAQHRPQVATNVEQVPKGTDFYLVWDHCKERSEWIKSKHNCLLALSLWGCLEQRLCVLCPAQCLAQNRLSVNICEISVQQLLSSLCAQSNLS